MFPLDSAKPKAAGNSGSTTTGEGLILPDASACWILRPRGRAPLSFVNECPPLAANLKLNQNPGMVRAWRLRSLRMPLDNMSQDISVLVADDHPVFREGLRL